MYNIHIALTSEDEGEDLGLQLKLLTLLDNPNVIVAAAASGDVGTLQNFLRKHPSQVCMYVLVLGELKNYLSINTVVRTCRGRSMIYGRGVLNRTATTTIHR